VSVFDDAEAAASDAYDEFAGEPVVWHPMLRRGGGQYTTPTNVVDPDRPVSDPFPVIVTWAPTTEAIGVDPNQGRVSNFQVMLDISRQQFIPYGGQPRQFDRFELQEEPLGSRWLEIQRIADDDSDRLIYYCNLTKP
jgi:hypothetical protein